MDENDWCRFCEAPAIPNCYGEHLLHPANTIPSPQLENALMGSMFSLLEDNPTVEDVQLYDDMGLPMISWPLMSEDGHEDNMQSLLDSPNERTENIDLDGSLFDTVGDVDLQFPSTVPWGQPNDFDLEFMGLDDYACLETEQPLPSNRSAGEPDLVPAVCTAKAAVPKRRQSARIQRAEAQRPQHTKAGKSKKSQPRAGKPRAKRSRKPEATPEEIWERHIKDIDLSEWHPTWANRPQRYEKDVSYPPMPPVMKQMRAEVVSELQRRASVALDEITKQAAKLRFTRKARKDFDSAMEKMRAAVVNFDRVRDQDHFRIESIREWSLALERIRARVERNIAEKGYY
ncbi:hypothetical protein BDW62DRAFT_204548 [Aspergillus aurantiobrunneus]